MKARGRRGEAAADPAVEAIETLREKLERQSDTLAEIAERMNRIHEDVRRTMEMATRLKLAGDNAKARSRAHEKALEAVAERLSGIEGRRTAKARGTATSVRRTGRR